MKKKHQRIRLAASMLIAALIFVNTLSVYAEASCINQDEYDKVLWYLDTYYPFLDEKARTEAIALLYAERIAAISEMNFEAENYSDISKSGMVQFNSTGIEIYVDEILIDLADLSADTDSSEKYNWITQNPEKLSELNDNDRLIISCFVSEYEAGQLLAASASSKISSATSLDSDYDITAARSYASTYWSDYNSAYPDWSSYGGDCANFVSQCLYAGGKTMVGSAGSSNATNQSNWFSYGTTASTSNVSSTWRGALAFGNYWSNKALAYQEFTFDELEEAVAFAYRGDAIVFYNDSGTTGHVAFVYNYTTSDLVLAAHTTDTITSKLSDYESSFSYFRIFSMKFS